MLFSKLFLLEMLPKKIEKKKETSELTNFRKTDFIFGCSSRRMILDT